MRVINPERVLSEILSINKDNAFLQYIVERLQDDRYRGWHVSQHNRFDLKDMEIIVRNIQEVAQTTLFAIPPGDYDRDAVLSGEFEKFRSIVQKINSELGRGTINSVKKNFFPDMDRMGFLKRERENRVLYGRLTSSAIRFIKARFLIHKYKEFTDGIDRLFDTKISDLAETIYFSDYVDDWISIYEFMFILSDDFSIDIDKMELLDSFRRLKKHEQDTVIELIQKYANPKNFDGDKTTQRDFGNWKNQAQQIMTLLKTTVYFEVHQDRFRLNSGNTGFFQEPRKRGVTPKQDYFSYHKVSKRDKFELHHIVPISEARTKKQAKVIDDWRNLIYIDRKKHRQISRKNVVLDIDPGEAIFSGFRNDAEIVKTSNGIDASYTKESDKISKISKYNARLLLAIFEYQKPV